MFSFAALLVVALLSPPGNPAVATDPVYAPLWLYQGAWQTSEKNAAPEAKPGHLENQCSLVGKYFACQQTVNGKVGALIVFVPAEKPGHYYTQAVLPEGLATGRGDLEIDGDHWTYSSKQQVEGKTLYHRTSNLFTGKDQIHYEVSESSDDVQWTIKKSGDEQRVVSPPQAGG